MANEFMESDFGIDGMDVMETVAKVTNGPEPSGKEAERWLGEHVYGLDDALRTAFESYVREHWNSADCREWNDEAL